MDGKHRSGRRAQAAGRTRGRRAWLLAGVGAVLAAGAGAAAVAQLTVREAPRIEAPVRAQVRAVAPRVVASPTLAQAEVVTPELVHRLDIPALLTFTVEAEDWGEMPELGFTVQDMSGWGSAWSGNKQIFWNPQPPGYAFKYDFSVTGGKSLWIYLTAAPDYAPLTITLGCYQQVSGNNYQLIAQHGMYHAGYATSVRRQSIGFPLTMDPKCTTADMYRLLFVAKPEQGRTFAGIDSIVVAR